MEKIEWLRNAEIFGSLDESGLSIVAEFSEYRSLSDGDIIFKDGDDGGRLFIVTSGTVQVLKKDADNKESIIAELVPGGILGELELFTGARFNASAAASGNAEVLSIPGEGSSLMEKLSENHDIAALLLYRFLRIISGRIRTANSLVRENSALIQELRRQVYGDKLTGLYNKTFLEETIPEYVKKQPEPVSLMHMKPDNFKMINDTFGHEAGDETLKIYSAALNHFVGERGIVFRYMGNEVGVILPGYGSEEALKEAGSILSMLNSLDISAATKSSDVFLSMSIGVAVCPDDAADAETLISLAHELPLAGRERGGNIILFPVDVWKQGDADER